jgi:hypothetical protein
MDKGLSVLSHALMHTTEIDAPLPYSAHGAVGFRGVRGAIKRTEY